jgi:hypothetical protein
MGIFSFFKGKHEVKQSKKPVFIERRILPRWQISAPAKLRWEGQNEFLDCQVINLNMRGFSVAIGQKIPRDCRQLTIYFSEKYIFTVEIAISWQDESEGKNTYGAKFTRIRDLDKEKMYQMMRDNFPNQIRTY